MSKDESGIRGIFARWARKRLAKKLMNTFKTEFDLDKDGIKETFQKEIEDIINNKIDIPHMSEKQEGELINAVIDSAKNVFINWVTVRFGIKL